MLTQEQSTKAQLEQQLADLESKIQNLVNEAEQLRQEKRTLAAETAAKEQHLSQVNSQLQTDLSNKNEEMGMLKESFSVLLAEKEGGKSFLWAVFNSLGQRMSIQIDIFLSYNIETFPSSLHFTIINSSPKCKENFQRHYFNNF